MPRLLLKHHNVLFIVYGLLSFALIIFSTTFPQRAELPRQWTINTLSPLINWLSLPSIWISEFGENMTHYLNTADENRRLNNENKHLYQWKHTAIHLQQENDRLRTLLKMNETIKGNPVTTHIMADSASPFARSILVPIGKNSGLERGHEALNEQGMIGRVVEVFDESARILLITDYTFRLPVRILESRVRGLLRGTNGHNLELMLLESDASIHSGMTVVTSGVGNIFSPNIPVGVLRKEGDKTFVTPDVDFSQLEHITINRRKTKGILQDE